MKRWVLMAVGAVGFVILSKLLIENLFGIDVEAAVQSWLAAPGSAAAVLVIVLLIADLLLPIPSSLVMVLSGALFGPVAGTAVAMIGSVGCSIVGFELARKYGRSAAIRIAGAADIAHLERTFDRYGAGAVFITRAVPVMKEAVSVVAGLSVMPRGRYLAATLAGSVPEAAVYAYAGAASREAGSFVPALVIILAVAAAGWMFSRRELRLSRD